MIRKATLYIQMEVSEAERQMLEVVRDHEADATSDFRLLFKSTARDLLWSLRRFQDFGKSHFARDRRNRAESFEKSARISE